MTTVKNPYIRVNGAPAGVDQLRTPVLLNFGHFTALQVRSERVRGLDWHLERLDSATLELYGVRLPPDRTRAELRDALAANPEGRAVTDAGIRINVFWPEGAPEPAVMVTVSPPGTMPDKPQSLSSVTYQRPAPHLKNVGGFGQHYHRRRAQAAGYDEALLVDSSRVIAETAICNIGFFSGDDLVWPDAPALHGITMRLLEAAGPSRRATIRLADIGSYDAAFVCNSLGIAPVSRIDKTDLRPDHSALKALMQLYAATPADLL